MAKLTKKQQEKINNFLEKKSLIEIVNKSLRDHGIHDFQVTAMSLKGIAPAGAAINNTCDTGFHPISIVTPSGKIQTICVPDL